MAAVQREEITAILEEFSVAMHKFSFEKARDLTEEHRVKYQSAGSHEPIISSLMGCLAQLTVAEKSYLNFGFLHPKGFLRKEGVLKTNFNAIRSDLLRLVIETQGKSPVAHKESLVGHLFRQLHGYVSARIDMMNFYEKLSLLANSKGFCLGTLTITSLIEEVHEKHKGSFHHPALALFFESFQNECEILIHLLKSSISIFNFEFFKAMEHLHLSRGRLELWTDQFEADQNSQRSGWFVFRSTPSTQVPLVPAWLKRFHECLMGKFSLYFYESLSKQVSAAELKTQMARLPSSSHFTQRIYNFHRRHDPIVIAAIINSQELTSFRGFGYSFPGKPAEVLKGLESYPVMFSVPSDRISCHLPAIVMMINEAVQKPASVADHIDFVFDSRSQLSYFLCNVESSMFITVVFASRKGERDSNVTNFLQEISADLRDINGFEPKIKVVVFPFGFESITVGKFSVTDMSEDIFGGRTDIWASTLICSGYLGLRVVRMPNWSHGDADGVEGTVGTVIYYDNPNFSVIVRWDDGNEISYAYRSPDLQYELLIFDSGPVGTRHNNVQCRVCETVIGGARWKCSHPDCTSGFNLCSPCYHSLADMTTRHHDVRHNFIRFDFPDSHGVVVGNRWNERRVKSRGVFINAIVKRGTDWCWDEQDGGVGSFGTVKLIHRWSPDCNRSARGTLVVEWHSTKRAERYRFGMGAKTEIIGASLSEGTFYYPRHLPILGTCGFYGPRSLQAVTPIDLVLRSSHQPNFYDLSHSNEPSTSIIRGAPAAVNLVEHGGPESLATYSLRETSKKFLVGEFVRIKRISDSELTRLTEAVAAWNPLILTCRNEIGYIHKTTISSNAVRVQFRRSLGRWSLNPLSLDKIQEPFNHKCQLRCGNQVRVISDLSQLIRIQMRANWDEEDNWIAGKWVTVMIIHNDMSGGIEELTVQYLQKEIFTFKFECFEILMVPSTNSNGVSISSFSPIQMATNVVPMDYTLERLRNLVDAGVVSAVKEFLVKNPMKINEPLLGGLTALALATTNGDARMVETLLQFSPIADSMYADHDTPLLIAIKRNCPTIASMLVRYGVNVNFEGADHKTPLYMAVERGFSECVKVLLESGRLDVNKKGPQGSALHLSILEGSESMLNLLMDHPSIDFLLLNQDGFNSFHLAVIKNNTIAMNRILRRQPAMLNQLRTLDGFAAIHLAITYKALDTLKDLCVNANCDINLGTQLVSEKPIHLAIRTKFIEAIDVLVSHQCDIQTSDINRDSPLHYAAIALSDEGIPNPSQYTSLLNVTDSNLTAGNLKEICLNEALAGLCFLLLRGADPYEKNRLDEMPLKCLECLPGYTEEFVNLLLYFHRRLVRNSFIPQVQAVPPASTSSASAKCHICFDLDINRVLVPCGHSACDVCLDRHFKAAGKPPVGSNKVGICDCCRGQVESVIKLFLS